jgi:hypothetical protein
MSEDNKKASPPDRGGQAEQVGGARFSPDRRAVVKAALLAAPAMLLLTTRSARGQGPSGSNPGSNPPP